MAGSAQDVEAGRAYVSLYLRRTNYDRQVDDLKRNEGGDRPSAAIASTTEAGASIPVELAGFAVKGAAMKAGSMALTGALAKLGITAAATAPALAATGTAAGGASIGLGAMLTASLPLLVPLAAIAAVAGTVYVTIFKWEKLPFIVRALMLVLSPLVVVIRAVVLAFKALRLAVAVVTAPFWLAAKAVQGFFAAIRAIPRVITATIRLMGRLSTAAAEMAVKVAKAAANLAKSAAAIPGRIAQATSAGLRSVGISIAKIGAIGAGITAAIVGPATLAARSWAAYGETIRGVQNDLLKFQLTAEEASIIARVSDQTGESVEKLAEQMRDGTRDFSRWRNELLQSGTLMSGAGLSAALALSRAYYSLKESVVGLKNAIGAALGPALTESAELFTGMIRGVTQWVSENKPLVVQIFKIASAVGIAAGVITTLGGAIAGVGAVISPFVVWLAALAGVMAIIEVKTQAGRSLWAAYGDSVRRVYGTVVQYLGDMMAFADRVIGGVTDALMAGDLAAAVDIMWAAAKVAWISALLEIDELTSGTFGGILQNLAAGKWAAASEALVGVLTEAWINITGAADTAWTGILSGWEDLVLNMKIGLHGFVGDAIKGFERLVNAIGAMSGPNLGIHAAALNTLQRLNVANDAMAPTIGTSRDPALQTRQEAREARITALRQRRAELAQQVGKEAERERTANQKALDAALAAAAAARDAAKDNKLRESDFAVSRDVQSIARFSGEALGLSVGRGDDPAKRTAKLSADQLKELQGLRQDIAEHQKDVQRAIALGGFR